MSAKEGILLRAQDIHIAKTVFDTPHLCVQGHAVLFEGTVRSISFPQKNVIPAAWAENKISGKTKQQTVLLVGNEIQVSQNTVIDVSGMHGSGVIHIGGGLGGGGHIFTSKYTDVSSSVHLYNDAFLSGSGGNVILWADIMQRYRVN